MKHLVPDERGIWVLRLQRYHWTSTKLLELDDTGIWVIYTLWSLCQTLSLKQLCFFVFYYCKFECCQAVRKCVGSSTSKSGHNDGSWALRKLGALNVVKLTAPLLKQPAPECSLLLALLGWSLFFTCRAISLEQRPTSTQKSRYLFQIQNSSQNISISQTIASKLLVVLCHWVLADFLFFVPGVSSLTDTAH